MNLLMLSGDRGLAAGEDGPFRSFLEEFRRHWHRIDILCPRVAAVRVTQPFANVAVHPSPAGRLGTPAYFTATGARLAANPGLDLVVSHDYGLFRNAVAARALHRRAGLPWVSEIHHIDGVPRAPNVEARLRRAWARRQIPRIADEATAVRAVCRQVADRLVDWGITPPRLRVLGSLYLDFAQLAPARAGSPRDLDLLVCARLAAEKGIWLALDAFARVRRRRPETRLTLVGRGPLAHRVRARLRSTGLAQAVTLVDWVESPDALAELYRRARVVLCTSFAEGNPRVVAEAMACGAAVVSTAVGRVPELVRDGVNGRIVGWDAVEIAEAVGELLSDEPSRARLGAAAPEAVAGCERTRAIGELAAAYRTLAAEARR